VKKFSRPLGLAGLILALLGGAGYVLAPQFKGFYVIPWVLAVPCLAFYGFYNLEAVRKFLAGRSARYGAGSALSVLLVLGILILVSAMTAKNSVRFDLTTDKRHSLAPQTLKVLEGLSVKVKATGFFQGEGGFQVRGRDLLDQYAHVSSKFEYEIVDPDRHPARAKAAGITRYDTVVVEAGGRSEKINNLSEERLTNALIRLTRPGKKVVYFLTGHGEKDPAAVEKNGYSTVKTALEDQNYEVKSLLLMQTGEMPEDAAVLVAAGPQKALFAEEIAAIDRYLRQGGKVLFLIDPETAPELADYLAGLGVKLGDDIIVDKMSRLFGGEYLIPLVAKYPQHPVTRDFNLASFFPVARSVSVSGKQVEGVKVAPLAETSDQAWAETDLKRLNQGQAQFVQGQDIKGPIPVAVAGTISLEEEEKPEKETPRPNDLEGRKKEGRFIVFGDSDFAANAYFRLQGNGDLFLNSVSWLAEEADLAAIRPKEAKAQPLMLSAIQARLIFWFPVVILPLAVLVIGVLVLTRRSQSE